MTDLRHSLARRARTLALPLVVAGGVGACGVFQRPPGPGPARMAREVESVLNTDEPSPEFFRARARLEAMGPELDPVLARLLEDPGADQRVRANAAILLADRHAPGAVYLLRRALLTVGDDAVRAGAVIGLWKLAPESPQAAAAIRAAINDPSRQVRLNVVQALDVEDAPLLRAALERESDPQVREIGRQLLSLFEARGAPLAFGRPGTYRGTGPDTLARVVFQPQQHTPAQPEVGALWVELPGATLVPLAQRVETVAGVVPAFFDPARTAVVYEAEREIRIRDLRTGATRVVGPGVAPRALPFTDQFVYLEERPAMRRPAEDGTQLTYQVVRGSFTGPQLERMGTLRATVRPEVFASASPVRWMVIGEVREGFVLRGPGITPFLLPNPFEGTPRPEPPARP
jgi:hypothetical protein